MKRRQFISGFSKLMGALASRNISAQAPVPRSAVVIGVDKAGNLPRLRGAASGAKQIDTWLRGEGFNTKLLTDESGPVRITEVYDAIAQIANSPTAEQLVIYFAGHGFVNNSSELWMLSNSPDNPNEAVNVLASISRARESRIRNVAFISDACRSTANSLGVEQVHGSDLFPTRQGMLNDLSDVDVFYATHVGEPSLEVSVSISARQYNGIYTDTFLNAFVHPDDGMISTVGGKRVVPNRRMKNYLIREVRKRAEALSSPSRQIPDTQVLSEDNVYIGRVTGAVNFSRTASEVLTVQEVASIDLARAGIRGFMDTIPRATDAEIKRARDEVGYDRATAAIQRPVDAPLLARTGGVVVSGIALKAVVGGPGVRIETAFQAPNTLARVDLGNAPAGSIALQFDDGGGTVITCLKGFSANVVVTEGKVINVSYVPALGTDLYGVYNSERQRLDDLHEAVATAARFGVFRVEGDKREDRNRAAEQLASQVRILKAVDPTLGIYAAYAYSDAGLPNQVRSMREMMRGSLGADLFDVAMLDGVLTGRNLGGGTPGGRAPNAAFPAYPFCPMLSQGWHLLRAKDVRVRPEVIAARDHLRQSLWTAFDRDGINPLLGALQQGRLR